MEPTEILFFLLSMFFLHQDSLCCILILVVQGPMDMISSMLLEVGGVLWIAKIF